MSSFALTLDYLFLIWLGTVITVAYITYSKLKIAEIWVAIIVAAITGLFVTQDSTCNRQGARTEDCSYEGLDAIED